MSRHPWLADKVEIKDIQPNEEVEQFDLAAMAASVRATDEVDAIVHFGGVALEQDLDQILNGNIRGSYRVH